MYVAGSTVMSVTEVTKEKPGMGGGRRSGRWGEGALWSRETTGGADVRKEGGYTDGQKVTKVTLPMGIIHHKLSLPHITLEIILMYLCFQSPHTAGESSENH